jgi:hypothetical protein
VSDEQQGLTPEEIYALQLSNTLTQMITGLRAHAFEVACIHLNPSDYAVVGEIMSQQHGYPAGDFDPENSTLTFMGYEVHSDTNIEEGRLSPITKVPEHLRDKTEEELEAMAPRLFGHKQGLN